MFFIIGRKTYFGPKLQAKTTGKYFRSAVFFREVWVNHISLIRIYFLLSIFLEPFTAQTYFPFWNHDDIFSNCLYGPNIETYRFSIFIYHF